MGMNLLNMVRSFGLLLLRSLVVVFCGCRVASIDEEAYVCVYVCIGEMIFKSGAPTSKISREEDSK